MLNVPSTVQTAIDTGDPTALQRVLAQSPAAANELIRWGPGGNNITHPLHYVCDRIFDKTISPSNALPLIDLLIARGADVNDHAPNRETPLHGAASLGAEDVGIRLLDAGADPNRVGGFGETPLHWAAHEGLARLVARLLAAQAETAVRDKQWNATPLGWAQHGLAQKPGAASPGHDQVIALLSGNA